ncbi:penicillin-binding protein [soil metagenome]
MVFVLGFSAILVRLVVLQVADASAYQDLAQAQRGRAISVPAPRGSIFDRDLHELAMSLPAKAVFVDPALVRKPMQVARTVAGVLDLSPAEVYAAVTAAEGRFVYLARGVEVKAAERLKDMKLPGIGFLDETRRYYPAGAVASQVLGFAGVDGAGLEGLERQYDSLLAGREGHAQVEEDPNGRMIPQAVRRDDPPVPGRDIVLTIDQDLQYRAQASLERAVRTNKARGGTVIVMDPKTGDVLAMATYPWFDPNDFAAASSEEWRNRAVTDAFEPGSVNKVIMAAATLELGLVTLDQRFNIPDEIQVFDRTYHDAHSHPMEQMTLADIVAQSSNVGAITVAQLLGDEMLASYLYDFGFGKPTGIGFPGESPGILAPPEEWWGTTLPSISIGQGVAVTALQMTGVYATIANGGVSVQPRLVRGTIEDDGAFVPFPPSPTRRVVSEDTAAAVTRILSYAVQVGTGGEAEIPGFWVAGKTGTAQKPRPNSLGYSDKYVASFIGITPASDPALVVAAVLDEPETKYGAVAAAPLFQEVARFALALLRVPPAPKPPTPPSASPAG